MASYFIKAKTQSFAARDIWYSENVIIDFEKFEKVSSQSIMEKVKAKLGRREGEYKIEDITKL